MNALQQEQYTILSRAPFQLGAFARESYKAREGGAGGAAGRIVLLRRLDIAPESAPEVFAASQIAASLPADPRILRHYGLVEVNEVSSQDTGLEPGVYAVSEWLQGITLGERIRRVAPFSIAAALGTAIEIAQAIARAGSVGVEHGNLTADEVLITSDGPAKVADFVVGRAVLQSNEIDIPHRDGLSACAALLFEMLTGKPSSGARLPLSPRDFESGVPSALDGITRKASLGLGAGGYAGVAAMLSDLQAAREEMRLGRPLDWTPLDSATSGATAKQPDEARAKANPAFKPMRAAAGSRAADAGQSEAIRLPPSMPITPQNPEPPAATQQIPPARLDSRASDGSDDDREYDDYEPRRSRASSVLRGIGIILGSIVIIGVVFACVYLALLVSNVPSDITVPQLIGMQYSDAKTLASQKHFSLAEIGHANSDQWPQGAIYQQTPELGRMIKSGKAVQVFVSDGPRLLDVPDLSQTTQEKAEAVLQDAGLPLGSVQAEFDNIVPKGIVTSQQPTAGAKVARDQAINLIVSKGPPPPQAPANLSATCTVYGEIDLSWDQVPIANTYDIYRDGEKIQTGFPETEYSDVGLDSSRTHVYTVTAVDSNGESPASQPASAVAQPGTINDATDTSAGAVNGNNQPGQINDSDSGAAPVGAPPQGGPKQRQFHVRFHVPRGSSYTHNVQIQVQDATGTNTAYNQDLSRGDIVDEQVQGFGNRIILRIFIDGKLVKQVTK